MFSRVRRIFCNLTQQRRKRLLFQRELARPFRSTGSRPQIERLEGRSLLAAMVSPLDTSHIDGGIQSLRGHDFQGVLADSSSINGSAGNILGDLSRVRLPNSFRINSDTLANEIRTTNSSASDYEKYFGRTVLPLDGDFESRLLSRISLSDVDVRQVIDSPQGLFHSAIVGGTLPNLAPTLGPVTLSTNGSTINEGDAFTLTGRYSNTFAADSKNIRVFWGDGTNSMADVDTVLRTFVATHRYGDDGRMSIRVEVRDTAGAVTVATATQQVRNVAPTVQVTPNALNSDRNRIQLDGLIFDAGFLDTVSVAWLAYPAGSPLNTRTGSGTSFTLDRSAFPNSIWQITATATDDDGGSSMYSTALMVGTGGSESIQINDSTFASVGASRLIVMGMDGSDIIDGSQVRSGSNQLILDGGLGADYLFGGLGDDIYNLTSGADFANVSVPGGPSVIYQEGDDTYRLTPGSTLTIIDLIGNNTLDFGLADFGDGTGVSFDLSLINATAMTMQDVSSSQPAQHFVSTRGNFTGVIGSRFSDSLTAASGSTLWGGSGNDRFTIKPGTTTATIWGGADDDVLTSSAIGVTTLSFNGDDGRDSFINLGTVSNLVFKGGADDDVLVNSGTIVTTLSFGGDDGADTLRNAGSIASLAFVGGADDDVLVNTGTIVTTLDFGGDEGADTLWNTGSIGSLLFAGGADDDVLVNTGTIVTTLDFGGDNGSDTLWNTGSIQGLVFKGGADDDALVNTGTIVTTLSFGGDNGADTLWNTGSVAGISFVGGADDDALVNTSTTVTTLSFNGDNGADILRNSGRIVELNFVGGADDDALVNTGTIVTTLSFGGDNGADTLWNIGSIAAVTFAGGADDDVLVNTGTIVTTLSFGGDAGEDVLRNSGSVGGITFAGGADDDVLVNTGTIVTTLGFGGDGGADTLWNTGYINAIAFAGGADDDVLVNTGTVVTTLDFGGDSGADTLWNTGSIWRLTFAGGADDDALVNSGTIVTTLDFNGDGGRDTLRNTGDIAAIAFLGGADDDALVNTGTIVTTLSFGGDGGADTLWNAGSIGQIAYLGGADDDVLVNTGTIVTTLDFNGDIGADTLWNAGRIFAVNFKGGADDDVLVNTGTVVTTLDFGGDNGADTLWNTGSANAVVFRGGADDDALVNTGTIVTTLSFDGDGGADTLLNTGRIASVTFSGGADDDVLVNTGTIVTTLSFGGDDGADTLVNSGPANRLYFNGGAGDDALQNNATVVSIAFLGGADDDVLVNNGPAVTTIDFNGDVGADTLINNGSGIASIVVDGGAGPDSVRIEGVDIGNVSFSGGTDADSFTFNATGTVNSAVVFNSGAGSDFFVIRGSAMSIAFDGGIGNDKVIASGTGSMNLNGGEGDDTYQFFSNPTADVTIAEAFTGLLDASKDTVDFSSFTGGALTLDLRLANTWQPQGSGAFRIRLTDGMSLENVVGTSLADTIYGNARDNTISGAEYSEPFAGPVAAPRGVTQWVYLDFDSETNTGKVDSSTGQVDSGEREYSVAEREQVRQRVEASYRGPNTNTPWFDVRVVTQLNGIPAAFVTAKQFATIVFNKTSPSGRPGGLASEIDPGNVNLGGSAMVQINGMLGGVIQSSDGITHIEGDEDAFKRDFAHISDIEVGASQPAATSENYVKLSAKLAAHELGHLLGLRHQDSFGPIGTGVHNPPGAGAYNPVFSGPTGGFETFDHIGGSPASVGSTRFSDLNDLFFGEREAVKLSFANSNPAQTTFLNAGGNNTQSTAAALTPISIVVPNTLSRGLNVNKKFDAQITSIVGRIEVNPATQRSKSDWYSFTARAGDLINIDVLSNSVARFGTGADGKLTPNDYLDTIVRVYNANGELVPYHDGLAVNDDTFEPTDSSIVDLLLPTDGTYYIEVDSFNRFGDALGNPQNPLSPLNPANPNNILSNADFLKRFQDSVNDTDTGRYQLMMFNFRKSNASDLIDSITGFGGVDAINGGLGDSYALSFSLGEVANGEEGSVFSRGVTIVDRAATSWAGSSVDYGDGSGVQPLSVSSSGEFTLSNTWKDNGQYTVNVVIVDDIGQSLTQRLQVTVANVAPSASLSFSGPAIVPAGTSVTFSSTTSDPAGANDPLALSWAVTRNGTAFATQSGGGNYLLSSALAGIYVVSLAVNDGDNGITTVFTTLAVNAIPTVALTTPIDGVRGVASSFTFTATDSDSIDQAGLFAFAIQWGDGSTQTVTGPRSTTVSHVYSAVSSAGVFAISASATDARGGTSLIADKPFAVVGWSLMPDPIAPTQPILVIVGSQGADDIKVKIKDDNYYKVTIRDRVDDVMMRGTVGGDVKKILVFALGGNDRVTIDDDIELTSVVWGGSGDDEIKGGSGNDILLGESGNDTIWGGDGRDIIVGGVGADRLFGDSKDDILIAGFTAFESEFNQWAPISFSSTSRRTLNQQRTALEAIMSEWSSSRSYSERRSNIRGAGTGTRNNGISFLNMSDSVMSSNTVFDDSSIDKLWGDSGSDWFFANLVNDLGSVLDEVKDRSGSESQEDIDRWW